jgi:hypothetical protein
MLFSLGFKTDRPETGDSDGVLLDLMAGLIPGPDLH